MKIESLTNEEIIEIIHKALEDNNLVIKETKKEEIDKLMTKILKKNIIEEQINNYKNNFNSNEEEMFNYIIFVLVKYYYALYNKNLDLYKLIVEKNISLGTSLSRNKLYLLDNNLSKIFKNKEDYLNFISECDPCIHNFYKSLSKLDEKDKEKYIKDFVKIIKHDKRYLYRKVMDDKKIFMNVLNVKNIDLYGVDLLKDLNYKQRDLLDNLDNSIKKDNLLKVKDILLNKKINISNEVYNNDFLEKFSIEELENMTEEKSIYLNKALQEKILYQVDELLKKDVILPLNFIRYEIFENIDQETIEKLSKKAINEISKLKSDEKLKNNIKKITKKDLKIKENFFDKIKKYLKKK